LRLGLCFPHKYLDVACGRVREQIKGGVPGNERQMVNVYSEVVTGTTRKSRFSPVVVTAKDLLFFTWLVVSSIVSCMFNVPMMFSLFGCQ
jgi:hypothetical protein